MFGGLFDEDASYYAADDENDAKDTGPPPPMPLLRREISLSKNTMGQLESRLHELQKEDIDAAAESNKLILKLQADLEREKVKMTETKARIAREIAAIEAAMVKSKLARDEELKKGGSSQALDDETQCGVCLEKPRDSLVAPCGHIAMCHACASAIHKSRNPECPFCRVRIIAIYKTFHI